MILLYSLGTPNPDSLVGVEQRLSETYLCQGIYLSIFTYDISFVYTDKFGRDNIYFPATNRHL